VAELDDTVRELARLVTAALGYDMTTSVQASGRVAVRLGIGEDDDAGAAEAALRKALGLSRETAAASLAEPGRKTDGREAAARAARNGG